MNKKSLIRNRLSIDIDPKEHQKIKIFATLHGTSIKEYVLTSIRERLARESEEKQLQLMTSQITPALKEIWDNDKDESNWNHPNSENRYN
jgi:hypothetical protein